MISKAVEDATREVEQSVLRLTAILLEEREGADGPEVNHVYLQLVRDAQTIFEELLPRATTLADKQAVVDWMKAAEPLLKR